MIDKIIIGDILSSDCHHIAFAVNAEGINDSGFAGIVSQLYWPKLASIGRHCLGTTLSHRIEEKTYHACVVYDYENIGWSQTTEMIIKCLKQIKPQPHEKVGVLAMGLGLVGQFMGADFKSIINTLHSCPMVINLFTQELVDIKPYAKDLEIKIVGGN